MRRTILLAGVLPFVSAFLGGALGFSLLAPPRATAQSSELQEVRASAFTLVGPDGAVLALLRRSGNGNGELHLYDAAGTRRMAIVGSGVVNVYDQEGSLPVFRAGRTFREGPPGNPLLNGVQLGPDGSISMLPPSP